MSDMVNAPPHYKAGTAYELIRVLEEWGLLNNFARGNAIKYLARADAKGAQIQDLEKAVWYINHEIARLKKRAALADSLDQGDEPYYDDASSVAAGR